MTKEKTRIKYISFIFVLLGGIFLVRVVYIQLFFTDKLSAYADRQFQKKIKVQSKRGDILDRDGEKLAVSIKAYSIFADPKIIKNPVVFSRLMGKHLRISSKGLLAKLKKKKSGRFLWIKRQISAEKLKELRKSKLASLKGWGAIGEYQRKYFENSLGANLLGYVSADGNGLDGLEYLYDKRLSGDQDQWFRLERDAKGRGFFSDDESLYSRQKHGTSLQLTLSRKLQAFVEHELRESLEHHQAERALALVVDPFSGEIYAWAEAPSFNPEKFSRYRQEQRTNHILTDPLEPGSVVKPFLVAEALESEKFNESTHVEVPGAKLKIKNKIFKDVAKVKRESFSLKELLVYSSNIGIITLQRAMGHDRLRSLYEKLAFHKKALGMSGESSGILNWYPAHKELEYATMSFGQGFAITPLQLVKAFSVFARKDGEMLRPRLLLSKREQNSNAEEKKLLFRPKTLETVSSYLLDVVKKGTGRNASLGDIAVAGKTGTSQKLEMKNGKQVYSQKDYQASFIGYFPAEKPRFLIYTMIDSARKNGHSGALAAAPLFKKIARHALWLSPDQKSLSVDPLEKEWQEQMEAEVQKTLAR